MALEENTSPSSATGSTTVMPKPNRCASARMVSGVPVRPLPKKKSWPMTTWRTPSPSTSTSRDEVVGRQAGERRVEGEHDREVEAEALEQRELALERREVEVRLLGVEELARVRLEEQHAGRRAELARGVPGGGQQRLMPAMHAVEVAEREHRAARLLRHIPIAVNDAHPDPRCPNSAARLRHIPAA